VVVEKGCGCFEVVVDVEGFATTTSWMLKAVFFSDVINFRLGLVITPKRVSALEVVCLACLMDYYFYVIGGWLCGC